MEAGIGNKQADLDALPKVSGFRQRGLSMTRMETFTDAAFAFALTMLVISFDRVPASFEELLQALRNIPGFAASFAQIGMFWYAHHKWSRRYGLDDMPTVLLSLTLVFVTLIFVFPLRIVFSGMFAWLSGGWLPFELGAISAREMGWIFVIYGAGFVAMSSVVLLLYIHALNQRTFLRMDSAERFITRTEIQAWLILTGVGAVSMFFALLAPVRAQPFAGMIYASLAAIMPWFAIRKSRQFQALHPS